MKSKNLARALSRIILTIAVVFGFFKSAKEIVMLRSENESLKVQMQMLASQAEEVVSSQWMAADHMHKLDIKLTEQVAGIFSKAQMQAQWDALTAEITDSWTIDALPMQEFQTLPQLSFSQASVGMAAIRNNFKAMELRLAALDHSLQVRTDALQRLPSILPAEGWVSSRYGFRKSPTTGERDFHKGTDIAARKGSPVVAAAGGVVIRAGWNGAYGKLVEIDHGKELTTLYAHNGRLFVKAGDHVERGQKIGSVGMTGRTTGAHLHYEVRRGGVPINPKRFLKISPVQPFDGSMNTQVAAAAVGDDAAIAGAEVWQDEPAVVALIEAQPVGVSKEELWPDFSQLPTSFSLAASVPTVGPDLEGEVSLLAGLSPQALAFSFGLCCLAIVYQAYRKRRKHWDDRISMLPVQVFTSLVATPQALEDKREPASYWS